MGKKKTKNKGGDGAQQAMSPERYLRERVRLLPIDKCLYKEMGKDFELE